MKTGLRIGAVLFLILAAVFFGGSTTSQAATVSNEAQLKKALTSAGTDKIYIDRNITVSRGNPMIITGNKTLSVTGDASGKRIQINGVGTCALFHVKGSLTLQGGIEINGGFDNNYKDSVNPLIFVDNGSLILYNSTLKASGVDINQAKDYANAYDNATYRGSYLGGLVYANGGQVKLLSGSTGYPVLSGGHSGYGGGCLKATDCQVTMEAGLITKGEARCSKRGSYGGRGGNVLLTGGSFTMNGGVIQDGKAWNYEANGTKGEGNGCNLYATNGAQVTMNGGTIENGKWKEGECTYASELYIHMGAVFTMNDGVIRGSSGEDQKEANRICVSGTGIFRGGRITGPNQSSDIVRCFSKGELYWGNCGVTAGKGNSGYLVSVIGKMFLEDSGEALASGSTSPYRGIYVGSSGILSGGGQSRHAAVSGIYNNGGLVTLKKVSVRPSTTLDYALQNMGNGRVELQDSEVGVSARRGIMNWQSGTVLLANTSAFGSDAGVYNNGTGTVRVENSEIGTSGGAYGIVNESGSVTISGGSRLAGKEYAIANEGGTLTMQGGQTAAGNGSVSNSGTFYQSSGLVRGRVDNWGRYELKNGGITGEVTNIAGTFCLQNGEMTTATNYDTFAISGGTMTKLNQEDGKSNMSGGIAAGATIKRGSFTINGGSIKNSSAATPALSIQAVGQVTLNGGTIENTGGTAIRHKGTSGNGFIMNGGSVTGGTSSLAAVELGNSSELYGGTIRNRKGVAVCQKGGNVKIGGKNDLQPATIEGATYDVYKDCRDTMGTLQLLYNQMLSTNGRKGAGIRKLYLISGATFQTQVPRYLYLVNALKNIDAYLFDRGEKYKLVSPSQELEVDVPDYRAGRVVATCMDYPLGYGTYQVSGSEFAKNETEKEMVIPANTKDGWYLKRNGNKIVLNQWSYTVHFLKNGGTGTMKALEVFPSRRGSEIEKVMVGFTKENCRFEGWSFRKAEYADSNSPDDFGIIYGNRYAIGAKNILTEGIYKMSQSQVPANDQVYLYARWSSIPTIRVDETVNGSARDYYEGEHVPIDILRMGIHATDPEAGDISSRLKIRKITYADGTVSTGVTRLNTEQKKIGKGIMVVEVTNHRGATATAEVPFRILKNKAPELSETSEQWRSLDEYKGFDAEALKKAVCWGITMKDDVESREELEHNYEIIEGKFDPTKEGDYTFTVQVRDQYGHRFYMNAGEKRQYGTGKTAACNVTMHMIDPVADLRREEGYVRAISKEYFPWTLEPNSIWRTGEYYDQLHEILFEKDPNKEEDCQMIWRFTAEDRKKIREYTDTLSNGNIYTKEARDGFWERFSYCRIK